VELLQVQECAMRIRELHRCGYVLRFQSESAGEERRWRFAIRGAARQAASAAAAQLLACLPFLRALAWRACR
jgi:hypothetical protein